MAALLLLLIGIACLWGGTALTLHGAVRLSEHSGLSQGFIGLTVLAIGTDLPDLLVSVSGSMQQFRGIDASGIIVGSAIGSAINQGTLILGVAGLAGYLSAAPHRLPREGLILLLAIALTGTLAFDGRVGRYEGAALLGAYALCLTTLLRAERPVGSEPLPRKKGKIPDLMIIAVGVTTITVAAHLVVAEGLALASAWGVSQTLLGVLLVGVGTSLPKLILLVGPAMRGHAALSVGNVLGSNIFDLLVPVGLGAVIHPLGVEPQTTRFDLPVLAAGTVLLLVFLSRQRGLQRRDAAALIAFFVAYAVIRVAIE